MISNLNQFFEQCHEYASANPDPLFVGTLFVFIGILAFLILSCLIAFVSHNIKMPYIMLISGILSATIAGGGYVYTTHHYAKQAQVVTVKAAKTIDKIDQKYPNATILNDNTNSLKITIAFTKKPINNNELNQNNKHILKADNNCLIMTFNKAGLSSGNANVTYPYSYTFKSQLSHDSHSTKTVLTAILKASKVS